MKNLNEYKAEIFARSEKRIKERRERRVRAFAVALPLCLILVFGGIIFVLELNIAGFNSVLDENAEAGTTENADGIGDIQSLGFASFTVTYGDKEIIVDNPEKTADVYYAFRDAFANTDGGDFKIEYNDNAANGNLEEESINRYTVCFETADGIKEKYQLSGNVLYNLQSRAETVLTEIQLNELKELLHIAE